MAALRIIRRLRDLLDFTLGAPSDGDVVTYDSGTGGFVLEPASAAGAPTDVDYLVGTASGGISAEIVVGTAPGGELGGSWAAPTVDASHSGSSHASTQAAAEATAAAALGVHSADTTAVHGIADTSALALLAAVPILAPAASARNVITPTTTAVVPLTVEYASGVDLFTADAPNFAVSTIGALNPKGGLSILGLDTPAAPTVTNQGAAGSTAYSYKVVARNANAQPTSASTATATATGNATLNGSNFNRITWVAVAGAKDYRVYRTASAGTPASLGLVGTTANLTFDDTGIAGTGLAAGPIINRTASIEIPTFPITIRGMHVTDGDPATGVGYDAGSQAIVFKAGASISFHPGASTSYSGALYIDYVAASQVRISSGGGNSKLWLNSDSAGQQVICGIGNKTSFGAGTSPTAHVDVVGVTTTEPVMRLKAPASFTSDVLQMQSSAAVILSRFNKDGYFMTRKVAAPADADLANSELAIWLTDTPGATTANFKAKDSGGTVRSTTIALS